MDGLSEIKFKINDFQWMAMDDSADHETKRKNEVSTGFVEENFRVSNYTWKFLNGSNP